MSKKSRKPKNLKLLLLFVFVFIVVFAILYKFPFEIEISPTTTTIAPLTTTTTTAAPPTTTVPVAEGTLIIAFKDEDQKIPGGAVLKSMNFTVTGIEVYGEADEKSGEEAGEWVSILDEEKTLDLLKYTTTYAKIAEKEIDAGSYDKIKIMLSDGSVSLVHTLVGIYRPKVYTLSVQEETTVDHEFNITAGSTLTLILDFDVRYSVMRVGAGYSLTPIIIVSEQSGSATNMEEILS